MIQNIAPQRLTESQYHRFKTLVIETIYLYLFVALICVSPNAHAKQITVGLTENPPDYTILSKTYYGSTKFAQILKYVHETSIDKGGDGAEISIPFAWHYTTAPGETLIELSLRFFGNEQAATLISFLNPSAFKQKRRKRVGRKKKGRGKRKRQIRQSSSGKISTGTTLLIPAIISYKLKSNRSLGSISQQFYGSPRYALQLAQLNKIAHKRKGTSIAKENTVLNIPLFSTKLSLAARNQLIDMATGKESFQGISPINPNSKPRQVSSTLIKSVSLEIEKAIKEGRYTAVIEQLLALGIDNNADPDIAPTHAKICKQIATLLVAFDMNDGAKRMITRAMKLDPNLSLSEADSPKIRDLLISAD